MLEYCCTHQQQIDVSDFRQPMACLWIQLDEAQVNIILLVLRKYGVERNDLRDRTEVAVSTSSSNGRETDLDNKGEIDERIFNKRSST